MALVVPALTGSAGVSSVARFLKDVALRSGKFELKLVSLSMASDDPASLNLLSPRSWARGVSVSSGEWEGVPYTHVGALGGELEFQRYRHRAPLTMALADCDIVQVVCGYPAWANTVSGLGKPIALQVATRALIERRSREAAPSDLLTWFRIAMTRITNRLDDRGLRSVDAIQVENKWMLEYARKLTIERPVDLRYAPPGVDTARFLPLACRDLNSEPYILCVGRLGDARKNVSVLLQAFALLPEVIKKTVRLTLAGYSAPADQFWQQARSLGLESRVSFVSSPTSSELVKLYQNASVFVLPSDEEGLGIVLLEAMACGVPVISTRSGGPQEIISDDSDGYLVAIGDTQAIANGLNRLLTEHELNRRMGERARRKVEQSFDQITTGDIFIDMWERMACMS